LSGAKGGNSPAPLPQAYRTTRSRIIRARPTLDATTDVSRSDGLLMSGSRAKRTAAMMEAAMTMVEAKRSCVLLSCSSLEIALFISPISAPPRDAACQEASVTMLPGKSLLASTGALTRRADSRQQSKYLAWFRPGRGWSRRIPCTERRSRRTGIGAGSTLEQYRRIKGEDMHREDPQTSPREIALKEGAENRRVTPVGLVRT